jgi:lipid II:glycine glycyltransferase (peptidoglycan interpeptide bridge formation enzyme)
MLRIDIYRDMPDDWDQWTRSAQNESNICQSSYWARVIKVLDKATPYFLRIREEEDSILAQALVLKRYPYSRNRKRKLFPVAYLECLDGPVIFNHDRVEEISQFVLENIIRLAKRTFSTHIQITPATTSRYALDKKVSTIYQRHGFELKEWATYLVDLTPEEDDLFKSLKHASRKCINKCNHMGLKVTKIRSFEELEERFWKPYVHAEAYFGRKANYVKRETWDEDREKSYHYYIVEDQQGEVLAVLGMYIFNGVATEIASTLMPKAYEEKIPAQDLIHWEMMLEAKRLGASIFDMAGVNPNPTTAKEEGIRRFKEKWGGRYTEYFTYKKYVLPWLTKPILCGSSRIRRMRWKLSE